MIHTSCLTSSMAAQYKISRVCLFLLRFASHFIFLHSKLVLHSFESLFFKNRSTLFFLIWSCTSNWQDLILRGFKNTTGWRYSLHIQSTLPNVFKRGFVNKLNLIKRSRFLPRNSLLDLYFNVILTPVTNALPIWGCCTNRNEFNSLESIHCRAARVIYNYPYDMPSEDIRKTANWDSLFDTYRVKQPP